ncbi:MAG: hypothetical protein LBH07_03550 [Treponema sp.]|jgi:hypothetical protein|nr:hypothetical protein [Treponema sp.]
MKCGFVLLLFLSLCFLGCSPPIGSLGSAEGDGLVAMPNRMAYSINNMFNRDYDLKVFINYRGGLEQIPIDQVEISVEDPGNDRKPVSKNGFIFSKIGRHIIDVSYGGLSDHYSVEVTNPFGLGGGGDDGNGITIEWAGP